MDSIIVTKVIGTGDPFDAIFMLPLIHQWGAARACATEQKEPCEAPIGRMVILAEPGLTDDRGFNSRELAYCEPHYQTFIARAKAGTPAAVR